MNEPALAQAVARVKEGGKRIGTATAALAALAMIASCAPRPAPPAPPPAPPAARVLPPTAPPPPPPADWQDAPLSPGDWSLAGVDQQLPTAVYETPAGDPVVMLMCRSPGRILMVAAAEQGDAIIVRTTFGERTLPGSRGPGPRQELIATLAAADPLLDEIAFSRGRILVRVVGEADFALPSWPEPARVIEECRG